MCRKCHAKEKETGIDYPPEKMTDVVGLRVVTTFRDDMVFAVEKLLTIIEKGEPPFIQGSLEEAIVFSTLQKGDPSLITARVTQLVDNAAFTRIKVKDELSTAGYSSIHFVSRLNHVPSNIEDTEYRIPIEIQVRSVFEDAWGQIDHEYGYSIRREGDPREQVDMSQSVDHHLRVLKTFVDGCAQYSDLILREAVRTGRAVSQSGPIKSLDTPEAAANVLKLEGVSAEIYEDFLEIKRRRDQLDQEVVEQKYIGEREVIRYIAFAESFRSIFKQNELYLFGDGSGPRILGYFIRMEEALCGLSAGTNKSVSEAARMYEEIEVEYKTYPMVPFRRAQALSNLGRPHESIKSYERCGVLLKKMSSMSKEKQQRRAPAYGIESLKTSLPKLLGYQYWRAAEIEEDAEHKRRLLEMAYKKTLPGLRIGDAAQKFDILNNLLFYAVEFYELCRTDEIRQRHITKKEIIRLVEKFEKKVEIKTHTDARDLDTLGVVYIFLERFEDAFKAAKRVLSLLLHIETRRFAPTRFLGAPVRSYTDTEPARTEMCQRAWQIIENYESD